MIIWMKENQFETACIIPFIICQIYLQYKRIKKNREEEELKNREEELKNKEEELKNKEEDKEDEE